MPLLAAIPPIRIKPLTDRWDNPEYPRFYSLRTDRSSWRPSPPVRCPAGYTEHHDFRQPLVRPDTISLLPSPNRFDANGLGTFCGWKRQLHSIREYDRPAFLADGGRNSRPVACLEVCDLHKAIGILRVLKHARHLVCKAERAVLAAKELPLPHFFSTFGTFHDRTFFYSLDF